MNLRTNLIGLALASTLLAGAAWAAPVDTSASSFDIATGCIGSPFSCTLTSVNGPVGLGGEADLAGDVFTFGLETLSQLTLSDGSAFGAGVEIVGSLTETTPGSLWRGQADVSGTFNGTLFALQDVAITGDCDGAGCDLLFGRGALKLPYSVGTEELTVYLSGAARVVTESSPIPEPASTALFMLGAVLVGGAVRRNP